MQRLVNGRNVELKLEWSSAKEALLSNVGLTMYCIRLCTISLNQGSFDHVKVGPTPVLAFHNL